MPTASCSVSAVREGQGRRSFAGPKLFSVPTTSLALTVKAVLYHHSAVPLPRNHKADVLAYSCKSVWFSPDSLPNSSLSKHITNPANSPLSGFPWGLRNIGLFHTLDYLDGRATDSRDACLPARLCLAKCWVLWLHSWMHVQPWSLASHVASQAFSIYCGFFHALLSFCLFLLPKPIGFDCHVPLSQCICPNRIIWTLSITLSLDSCTLPLSD